MENEHDIPGNAESPESAGKEDSVVSAITEGLLEVAGVVEDVKARKKSKARGIDERLRMIEARLDRMYQRTFARYMRRASTEDAIVNRARRILERLEAFDALDHSQAEKFAIVIRNLSKGRTLVTMDEREYVLFKKLLRGRAKKDEQGKP